MARAERVIILAAIAGESHRKRQATLPPALSKVWAPERQAHFVYREIYQESLIQRPNECNMGQHIVIVDDDKLMCRSLAFHLEQAGYRTSSATSAETALAIAQRDGPDLVLLDIGLPGMDGLQALSELREAAGCPVIFVTARRRHLDEVLGLELGADDYVTKPFDMDVLLARVRAALRAHGETASRDAPSEIRYGDLRIIPGRRQVLLRGAPVALAPREFDLLHTLARAGGNVVRRQELMAQVWGPDFAGEPQVLYVHINWLREKLETNPKEPTRIVTVHGVGYKLCRVERDVTDAT